MDSATPRAWLPTLSEDRREEDMKKAVIAGLVAGAVLTAIVVAKKGQTSASPAEREAQRAEKRREMFEKMQAGMEAMPDDFPPKAMFDNLAAIRENSDRILELLESRSEESSG